MTDGGARTAIAAVTSEFAEFSFADTGPEADYGDGPLSWSGYKEQRARARTRSGESESVVCGQGQIGTQPVVLVAFDFRYIGGSLGQRAGTRICRAFEIARRLRWPVVSLISTGGSRMQEGMRSLAQLQRIARQCQLTRWEGLAHIAVLREPTTGGVWASSARARTWCSRCAGPPWPSAGAGCGRRRPGTGRSSTARASSPRARWTRC